MKSTTYRIRHALAETASAVFLSIRGIFDPKIDQKQRFWGMFFTPIRAFESTPYVVRTWRPLTA